MTRIRYSQLAAAFAPPPAPLPSGLGYRPPQPDDAREITSVVYVQRPQMVTVVEPLDRSDAESRIGHTEHDVVYQERAVQGFQITPGLALAWPGAAERPKYSRFAVVARAEDKLVEGASLHLALHPYSRDLTGRARFKPGCNKGQDYINRAMATALADPSPDQHLEEKVPYYLFATDTKTTRKEGESTPVRYAACMDPVRVARGTATGRQTHDPRLLVAICTDEVECRRRLEDHPNATLLLAAAQGGSLFQDFRYPSSRGGNWPALAEGAKAKAEDALRAAIEFALAGPLSDDVWKDNRRGGSLRSVIDAVQASFLELMWNLHSREAPEHREPRQAARRRSDREAKERSGFSRTTRTPRPDSDRTRPPEEPSSVSQELQQARDRILTSIREAARADDGQLTQQALHAMEGQLSSDDPESVLSAAALGLALVQLVASGAREAVHAALSDASERAEDDASVVLQAALAMLER